MGKKLGGNKEIDGVILDIVKHTMEAAASYGVSKTVAVTMTAAGASVPFLLPVAIPLGMAAGCVSKIGIGKLSAMLAKGG